MAADDKIIIEFDGDIKRLKAKLRSTGKDVDSLGKSVKRSFAKGIPIAAKAGAVAIAGFTAAIGGAVKAASNFEQISTQFEVLTGSAQEAAKVVKDLQEFSASTPFQFEGISKAAQQLLGFGFSAEQLVPKLQQIGDVAAAIGKPIDEVGFIFGQVAAAGKLTGERLLQFQERAIPIGPAIARTMGIAENAVKDAVSKGQVDLATFERAFASLSEEGGLAFGGMIKQSKTLGGLLSTVADNVSIMAADVGKELLPVAKEAAGIFLEWIKRLRESDSIFGNMKKWGSTLKESIGTSASRAAASLKDINKELKHVNEQIGILERKRDTAKDGIFGDTFGAVTESEKQLKDFGKRREKLLRDQEAQYAKINQEAESIRKMAAATQAQERAKEAAVEAKIVAEKKKEANLEAFKTRKEEIKNENDLLSETELEKLNIRLQGKQLAKDEAAAMELEKKGQHEEAMAKLEEIAIKKQQLFSKMKIDLEKKTNAQQLADRQAFLSTASSLARSENKKLAAIGKAAALTQIAIATPPAVASSFNFGARIGGPPLGTVFAGVAYAAMAAQAAQVAGITGFATGGMVEGGVAGKDSVGILAQRGEVVVPPQTSFQDIVDAGRAVAEDSGTTGGGGSTEVIISLKDNIGEFIEATVLERRMLGVGAI